MQPIFSQISFLLRATVYYSYIRIHFFHLIKYCYPFYIPMVRQNPHNRSEDLGFPLYMTFCAVIAALSGTTAITISSYEKTITFAM
ncbi:hypothetical protein BDC45DRAFT_293899 [Circinella umbellata]|nr:hypothetical protein BDC45DRAFT_293899 [Circinella umbellata]